jgi:superfamily II DNA or RNA helicase
MNLPRHPKAKHFHGLGLMAGVQSFAELETRIASLPTEQARGAALEVFAEACLATQRVYQAREVWPGNSMPSPLRQQLRLPMADMGVDGVFVTRADEAVCYQSKFRTGRPALTWTELSTFYGLADVGGSRLVFTNCDEVARVAEERLGAIFIRGSDLDRLTPEDFQVIEAWLAERPVILKRHDPKPHQGVALDDIVGALSQGSRATALMACGSGKTLVALWAAERLGARTVLILLPSLALVRQTLHEWLHQTSWPNVQFLCVCSDPTVQSEEDSLLVRPSDLDFAVTTQAADVRRFLERPTDSVRLVFSTYQSSQVVAAAVAGLPPFDFGVFDEAHKTAGRGGARFALALKDENLPIARRLFMTATPRHYDVAKKDKFGESKVVFSMDVPETYGQVVHRLPFSAAAKAGIITDYKVIISVVTSEMVTNEALRLGVVLVEGDEVKARQVANQIALKSAIEKYNVSKVFTFHSKVDSAKSFTSRGPEGIGTHLEGFHCAHIEGAMTTAYRERLLREFAAAPRAILSNARCLTEGVDVPAVDMVAFLSPKRSLVDIVQATGRAMRLSPETGKQFGYVLVPLYVEKARGETIEQAVLRSNFDEVWKVLQGLKEQDDLLAQIIAEMRTERGRTGGFDDTRFRERVEMLGPELSLEMLRSTITAACLDAIGENWFERYGQLVAYKQMHGNCDIPARWRQNKPLGAWVVAQRVARNEGRLSADKIALLDSLAFNWKPRPLDWESMFERLRSYKERYGNCDVPQHWADDPDLGIWVSRQRVFLRTGKLKDDRRHKLEAIGFQWNINSSWSDSYTELQRYTRENGHCRIDRKHRPKLAAWATEQRYFREAGQLSPDKIQLLNDIGFPWEKQTRGWGAWEKRFEELLQYKRQFGHCNVPSNWPANQKLGNWVGVQRKALRDGGATISEERLKRLKGVGFVWDYQRNTRSWEEMLESFRQNGRAPIRQIAQTDPHLVSWIRNQRQARKAGKLSEDRIKSLEEAGFNWGALQTSPGQSDL